MWHTYPTIVRGEGITLVDDTGRRYIDAAGGAIVVNAGHGVQAIAQAIAEQAAQVAYVHAEKFTTPVLEAYAAALAERERQVLASVASVRTTPLTCGCITSVAGVGPV